jgi:dTDP-4-dehydrorhamnose 3,5-epimerase
MKLSNRSKIDDVKIFNLEKFKDDRGDVVKIFDKFLLPNQAHELDLLPYMYETYSKKDVLRGIHYQVEKPQSRLLRVSYGAIYDVVLDLRRSSPTFGKWQGEILTSENSGAIWVPAGVAHGYLVMSDFAIVNVQTSCDFLPDHQRVIRWNDPTLTIDWPIYANYPIIIPPILSPRDQSGIDFIDAEYFD